MMKVLAIIGVRVRSTKPLPASRSINAMMIEEAIAPHLPPLLAAENAFSSLSIGANNSHWLT